MVRRDLWEISELVKYTDGKLIGEVKKPINGVSIDSRTIVIGDIFVAIKGDNFDGHDYTKQALINGAAIAIISREFYAINQNIAEFGPLLIVVDPLIALEELGRAARKRCKATIIAITGSVGKTSTKEMLRSCLEVQYKTHASVASYNNHWGVPLSLARMPIDTEYGVFEVGMNHSGEIANLVPMINPHISIITTIAPVHLGHFKDIQEIAYAKAEIFQGMVSDGTAILNIDNPMYTILVDEAKANNIKRTIAFGESNEADVKLTDVILYEYASEVTVSNFSEEVNYEISIPGKHFVLNSLAVLACFKELNIDISYFKKALSSISASKGRGGHKEITNKLGKIHIIDESYNANPASMHAALNVLGQIKPKRNGRRVAVLGDMLELGETSGDLHKCLLESITNNNIDLVFLCGQYMRELWNILPDAILGEYAVDSKSLANNLLPKLKDGDVIMVKGSLGSNMQLVLDEIVSL